MKALCGAVGVAVVRLEEAAWRFLAALCDGEPLLWQPASIDDNNGCSKAWSNSFTGSNRLAHRRSGLPSCFHLRHRSTQRRTARRV
jgi:hypothetical protein